MGIGNSMSTGEELLEWVLVIACPLGRNYVNGNVNIMSIGEELCAWAMLISCLLMRNYVHGQC